MSAGEGARGAGEGEAVRARESQLRGEQWGGGGAEGAVGWVDAGAVWGESVQGADGSGRSVGHGQAPLQVFEPDFYYLWQAGNFIFGNTLYKWIHYENPWIKWIHYTNESIIKINQLYK